MTQNPYESPREVGYDSPALEAWRRWLWDRVTLLGCGIDVFFMILDSNDCWLCRVPTPRRRPITMMPPRPFTAATIRAVLAFVLLASCNITRAIYHDLG